MSTLVYVPNYRFDVKSCLRHSLSQIPKKKILFFPNSEKSLRPRVLKQLITSCKLFSIIISEICKKCHQ